MPAHTAIFRVVVSTLQELNGPVLRKPVPQDYVRLLSASAIWGSSFLLIEIALQDFSPLAIATYRIVLATILILIVCKALGLVVELDRRMALLLRGHWRA